MGQQQTVATADSTPCTHWFPHICRDRPGLPLHPTFHSCYVVGAMVGRSCGDSKCLINKRKQGTFCVRAAAAELHPQWNSSPLVRRGRRRGRLALNSPGASHSCFQHHDPHKQVLQVSALPSRSGNVTLTALQCSHSTQSAPHSNYMQNGRSQH